MKTCRLCQTNTVATLRDFGPQPICNRFLADAAGNEDTFPLVLGQCSQCGLVQITEPVPPDQLRTRHPWITYTEPSEHLDRLASQVSALPRMTVDSTICGIFLPADPTLARFKTRGFIQAWRLDIQGDLGINDPCAGTETIQARFDENAAENIAQRRGRPDAVLIRHILEHTHDIGRLMKGLHRLVSPKGYVIFEVPDCQPALETGDYSTLWEEHQFYFTLETFSHCLERNQWRVLHKERTGPSLVAIAAPAGLVLASWPSFESIAAELARAKEFAAEFPARKAHIGGRLADFARDGGNIAVFGAGHLSCVFINLMEIKNRICCVIDDHEKKPGLFMPGSRLPIASSPALLDREITLCLSSLGYETDARLQAKNPAVREFLAKGGRFASIFPAENSFFNPMSGH